MVAVTQVQAIEAALRMTKPDASDEYNALAGTHRRYVALAANLADLEAGALDEARPPHAAGWRRASGVNQRHSSNLARRDMTIDAVADASSHKLGTSETQ